MDLGDIVFIGALLASGVASVIGAAKKKNAAQAAAAKPAAAPKTGLPKVRPQPPRSAASQGHVQSDGRAEMGEAAYARADAAQGEECRSGAPSRRRRTRWQQYMAMRVVLGPPKSLEQDR